MTSFRYDEHCGPRNAASAFVPREAALAARKAAMDREKAIAQAVPLPHTDDTDLEPVVVSTSAPTRRIVMPKLPMPKFSLSSRPTSQTGRARTSGIETPTPIVEKEKIVENVPALTPIRRTASPGEMPAETAIADAKPPSRSASDKALASRGNFGQVDGNKPVVPLTGLDPVSAVPPRLLSAGTMAAVPGVPPPSNANLLSEALMMERGRRRLAAAGQPVPPALAMLRVPSATSMGRIATPNRQPTPPSATSAISQTVGPPASVGILSPIPVKRTPKFKSVPTPISGTPISEQHIENPMEIMKINKMEKEGE